MVSPSGRTEIKSRTELTINNSANNVVVFNFDETRPLVTRFVIPKGSIWEPGLHWHETHTEYLQVIRGRVKVLINGVSKIITSKDGPQAIEKFAIHSWMRADRDSDEKDMDDVVVEEWTDPGDGVKQVFFRNALGILEDSKRHWSVQVALQFLLVSSVYDEYVVLAPLWLIPQWLTYFLTHLVYMVCRPVAKLCGLRPWYDEYTPTVNRSIAAELAGEKTKSKKV